MLRPSRSLVLATALAAAACSSPSPAPPEAAGASGEAAAPAEPARAQPRRLGRHSARFDAPRPDPTLPRVRAGATPPSFMELPGAALKKVERTGTYGGTLVYSILGEMDTFNPVEPKGATSQELREVVFSALVEYSNGSWEYAPALAERWEVSDDHRTWRFHVRRGLRWSDGEPVTMDDMELSFRAAFDERYKTSIRDGFVDSEGNLPELVIDRDAHVVQFTTAGVDSQFLTHVGNVRIIPAHLWKSAYEDGTLLQQMTNDVDPEQLVGTGPFKLKSYVPAEKIEYVRNPYYWKVDARGERLPYLDRVVVVLVKDMNLQWQKFEAGEHHLLNTLPVDHAKEAEALEDRGRARLLRLGTSLNTNWLAWNLHPGSDPETGKPYVDPKKRHWFTNLTFRKALNHAVDREGLVRAAFQGRGTPIWASYTPGNRLWHAEDVPTYPYDPDKARSMLDALGWLDRDGDGVREDDQGRTIEFSMNTNVENNVRQQVGSLLTQYFADVGVKVNFKPIVFNDLVTSLQDGHQWDTIVLGWGSGVPPDPANAKNITTSRGRLHVWYPQQPEPATEWEARVDELMGLMDRELDYEKRKAYHDEIEALISEHCPIFYLVAQNLYALATPDVGNLWPSPLRPELTWNMYELYISEAAPAG